MKARRLSAKKKNSKIAISLFSGIGGLDEGIHRAGYSPICCVEIDPNAYATLNEWCKLRGETPLLEKDINAINPACLKRTLGLKEGELDILVGGPPCQSFSLIGKRECLHDERGMLLFKMIEFARVFKPKSVLIEQVKGLLSATGMDGARGAVLSKVIGELKNMGYSVTYNVLRAADYGVPQLRERIFIVALYDKQMFQFPAPTHFDQTENDMQLEFTNNNKRYLTLYDAISDLPKPALPNEAAPVANHIDITPRRDRERINGVPEGECLAKQLHLPSHQRQRLDPKKDTTKFRRLSWDKPALTLRGGEVFYHPTENRYLSPREYMRLHGFADDHILIGPIRARSGSVRTLDQHRLVANAVPPPLAEVVAKSIYNHLFNSK